MVLYIYILGGFSLDMARYKTGEEAPQSGTYEYDGPINNRVSCEPTQEEKVIPLSKGEKFPPVKSCDKRGGAFWKLKNKA